MDLGAAFVYALHTARSFIPSEFDLGSDGRGVQHVYRSGLSKTVNEIELVDIQLLVKDGIEVFRWEVRNVPNSVKF